MEVLAEFSHKYPSTMNGGVNDSGNNRDSHNFVNFTAAVFPRKLSTHGLKHKYRTSWGNTAAQKLVEILTILSAIVSR